ncbi:MAG: potassium transporter TrkA, partial [Firmicutes bacterium]|nr:potassium transporter TrkA [Bacillota bacterium]
MAGALLMFVLLIMFYIVIADIITIFFRLAGMTEEKARFQVISLLTNSGFTTQESEAVVNSKIRRRLATATMIFGYAFTVTILSA